MKKLVAPVLFVCVCVGLVLANSPEAPSKGPTVADTLRQLERDLGDAMVAVDIDKINQILADDLEGIGLSGRIYTKESVLQDLKSGKDKLESFELGPMDVPVFGNVAAVHGSVAEARSRDGKDTSGEFVWMDLLEKRAGKWVIVRSAGARASEGIGRAGRDMKKGTFRGAVSPAQAKPTDRVSRGTPRMLP
jgi:ketosteroid isomerase-like protein